MDITIFQGETLPIALTVNNLPSDAVVSLALVRGRMTISKSWSTADGTLTQEDNVFKCVLSSSDSASLLNTEYAIEGMVKSNDSTTIRPLARLIVKQDKIKDI